MWSWTGRFIEAYNFLFIENYNYLWIDYINGGIIIVFSMYAPQIFPSNPNLIEQEDWWEFYYQRLKESLRGTEAEKEEVIRKRILKFFGDYKLD